MERQSCQNGGSVNCSTWDGTIEYPAGAVPSLSAVYCCTIQTPRLRPITLSKQLHLHDVTYCGTWMLGKTAARTSNFATFPVFAVCPHFSLIPLRSVKWSKLHHFLFSSPHFDSLSSKRHLRYFFLSRTQTLCSQAVPSSLAPSQGTTHVSRSDMSENGRGRESVSERRSIVLQNSEGLLW
jgi:hypothetical protein